MGPSKTTPTQDHADLVRHCSQGCVRLFLQIERLAIPNPQQSLLCTVARIYEACEGWRKTVDFAKLPLIDSTKQSAAFKTLERLSWNLRRALDGYSNDSTTRTSVTSSSNEAEVEADSDSSAGSDSDWPTLVVFPHLTKYWRRILADTQILQQQLRWLPRVPFQPIARSCGTLELSLDSGDARQRSSDENIVRFYVESVRGCDAPSADGTASSELERIQDAAVLARLVRALRRRKGMIEDATGNLGARGPTIVATKEEIRRLAADQEALPEVPSSFAAGTSGKCYFCKDVKWKREKDDNYRQHLLRHLRPYSCTYPSCTSSDELYDSLESWTGHEEHVEQLKWVCPFCGAKEHATFTEKDDFEKHLRATHSRDVDSGGVQLLLNYARQVRATQPTRCVICRKSAISIDGPLRQHLLRHFEQLGMLALYDCGPDIMTEYEQAESELNRQSTFTGPASPRSAQDARSSISPELVSQSTGYARRDKSFFVPGKVIQIRKHFNPDEKHDSAYGSSSGHASSAPGIDKTGNHTSGDPDKWFLIIKADVGVSHCLLISTNNGRGVSQSSEKDNYSPVCSSRQKSNISSAERPTTSREDPMQDDIFVLPINPSHPLPPMARISWKGDHEISHACEAKVCAVVWPRTEYLIKGIYKKKNPGKPDLDIRCGR